MAAPVEAYPWKCLFCYRLNKKTHEECPWCHAHWSTGQKHNTEPKTQAYYESDWKDWENWTEEWKDSQSRWSSRSPSRQRVLQDQQPPPAQSPRHRGKDGGSKGAKGRGKSKNKGKGGGKDPASDQTSPFQSVALPNFDSWTTLDATGFMPVSASSGSPFQLANVEGGMQEMAAALRRAYPDTEKAPEDVKSLLERADKEANRLGLKNLHQAAKHLDRSKKQLKEVNDQRKAHRSTWLKHVTEGIQIWEKQLDEYRRHQAMLTELAGRAQTEIATTSKAIQLLGAAGTGSALPSAQIPEAVDASESTEDTTDQEEEKLRAKLQDVLKSCAGSLGLSSDIPVPRIEEVPSDEESTNESKPPKRQRSLEPFGGRAAS